MVTQKDAPYILSSIRERLLMEDFNSSLNQFTITNTSDIEGSDPWDIIVLSANCRYLIEVKVRNQDINFDNWILEEQKFKKLSLLTRTEKALQNGLKSIYWLFLPNGVLYWHLPEHLHFFDRDSRKKTVEDQGREIKSVAYLKKADCVQLNYKTNLKDINAKSNTMFRLLYPQLILPNIFF